MCTVDLPAWCSAGLSLKNKSRQDEFNLCETTGIKTERKNEDDLIEENEIFL